MKKAVWSAVAALAFAASANVAQAQTTHATATINANVTVNTLARLTVSGDVNFLDTDPDTNPTVVSAPINVDARARVASTTVLQVTIAAERAFFDAATSTIPVTNVSWDAPGAFFQDGVLNAATAQLLANWTGPAQRQSSQTYSLVNSWAYAPGSYSMQLTYTLVTP